VFSIASWRQPSGATCAAVALFALLQATQVHAQPKPGEGAPAEALAACQQLAANQACSFTSPRGQVTGTCGAPSGKPLACRPANAPQPGNGMPPPQQ
jgi:hypothetical protein